MLRRRLDPPQGAAVAVSVAAPLAAGVIYIALRTDWLRQVGRWLAWTGGALAGDGYGAYVLDLCLIDGEVSIVELNGMMNAGLFALDMDALTRAMRARPDQFVPVSLDVLFAGRDACPVPV